MDVESQIALRKIYKVTGTPENFLTALRYKIWGFNTDAKKHWKKLVGGDNKGIIYMYNQSIDLENIC